MTNENLGLRVRAKDHRDMFDALSEFDAEQSDLAGQKSPFGFSNLLTTRMQNNKQRAMASPQWDAWFQALDEAAGGKRLRLSGVESDFFNDPLAHASRRNYLGNEDRAQGYR